MEEKTARARMWADLLAAETHARSAPHEVTRRAELYLHAGLPLERVLDALKVSRATWYRRVEALREHEAQSRTTSRSKEESSEPDGGPR